MTWLYADALGVPRVSPPGHNHDEAWLAASQEWLYGETVPALAPPRTAARYARDYDWARLTAVHAFWEEAGRGSLTKSVANLCSGLWRRRAQLVVSVQRDGHELGIYLGVHTGGGAGGQSSQVAGPLFAAALPGATLQTPGPNPENLRPRDLDAAVKRLFRGHATAIVGTPRAITSPQDRTLVEVLAESRLDRWTLTVEIAPVALAELVGRVVAFDDRLTVLGEQASVTQQETATRSVTRKNARVEQISAMFTRERERADQSLRRGGVVMTAWLSADEASALEGQTAVVASMLAPNRLEPRALVLIAAHPGGGAPGTFLVADEVAALIQPPAHDVRGFRVTEWSRFDAQPEAHANAVGPRIPLGVALSGAPLLYPIDRLPAHTLVTGITGSGKSSFLNALLHEISEAGRPYLVIEPTKDEYRSTVDADSLWAVGEPSMVVKHRLNPFEVPDGTPVQTHLDVLVALFTSSFSLISPLPFVLELAIRRAYEQRGWDLATNTNPHLDANREYPAFPCFSEIIAEAERVIEDLGYQGEVRHNVLGALRARLGAMTVGGKGASFDTDRPTDFDSFLSKRFVVNLDMVGSDEEKAFIIGLIVIRLWESRRGTSSNELVHLLVLEEAHRILRKDKGGSSEERSGAAFASEMFGNLLAEIRAAGQGVVIVDQSPRKLSSDALANTALKVAFRATYAEDKQELAASLNLDEVQQRSLTGMENHRAAVFWEGMDRPVTASMARRWPTPVSRRIDPAIRPSAEPADRVMPSRVQTRRKPTGDNGRNVLGRSTPRTPTAARGLGASAVRPTPELDELARVWLVATRAERAGVLAAAERAMRDLVPPGTPIRRSFQGAIDRAIERLGQARRWTPARRDELVAGVRGLPDSESAVRSELTRGHGPKRACETICAAEGRGCLVREAITPHVNALRLDGFTEDWPGLATDQLRQVTVRTVGAMARRDLVPSVAAIANQCLVAHVLEDRVPDGDVEATCARFR